jgi:gamma-glutamyltranspeptidase / glutathione hydrolase
MKKRYSFIAVLLISCSALKQTAHPLNQHPYDYVITKRIEVQNGAVVSAHALASKAGVGILKKGGNAVDAAIATQWALAVVYPGAGNIGGGGFMVARLSNGINITLDYRETAPTAAFRDMYLDEKGNAIAEKSLNGHLSCGVPGTVAGLFASLKYAKFSMKTLIQPAIDLAEKGFVITEKEAKSLNAAREDFIKYNTALPIFVKKELWEKGDTLVQKDLANTLKRIRDDGQKGFYEGETANLIVREMQHRNGIITNQDLKNYKAKWRAPHVFDYRGYTIIGMPMPSSGGLLLHQMLKMTEPYNIASLGFQTPASVQLMIEIERRAYADRAKYMGDADFYQVPMKELTDELYLKKRMKNYAPNKAGSSKQTTEGIIPGYESEETTHLSIIDKEGNAVSVTTTLNNVYGSKTVVNGAGFLLNDEMDDFSVKPGAPNMFGAIGGKANAIAPGKRMLSSMTPTIVLKNNHPYLVVGTPGGTTIPTSVYQTIINILDFGMSTEDAVNKPKFHHQWLPDRVDIEKEFSTTPAVALEKMGYTIYQRGHIGRTEVIIILPEGIYEAVADYRGDDGAEGY